MWVIEGSAKRVPAFWGLPVVEFAVCRTGGTIANFEVLVRFDTNDYLIPV
jgi:hypothetical protein